MKPITLLGLKANPGTPKALIEIDFEGAINNDHLFTQENERRAMALFADDWEHWVNAGWETRMEYRRKAYAEGISK
jgi:hypothetical protein